MEATFIFMDYSIMKKWRTFKSEQFRTPLNTEQAIGLWVDRIGHATESEKPKHLRILGLYAAVYIEAGTGEFYSPATGTVALSPGQTILLFPEEPTLYRADTEWTTKWIVWNGPEARMLENLGYLNRNACILPDLYNAVDHAHTLLSRIIRNEDLAAILERKTIVQNMILDLYKGSQQSSREHRNDQSIEEAITYLTNRYTKTICLEKLARRFNLSPVHFRRRFKQYTGKSPREFIISLRISRAKELLSQGLAIKEVSDLVGYDDLFYFMRIFKKTTGMPPGKFTFIRTPE